MGHVFIALFGELHEWSPYPGVQQAFLRSLGSFSSSTESEESATLRTLLYSVGERDDFAQQLSVYDEAVEALVRAQPAEVLSEKEKKVRCKSCTIETVHQIKMQ